MSKIHPQVSGPLLRRIAAPVVAVLLGALPASALASAHHPRSRWGAAAHREQRAAHKRTTAKKRKRKARQAITVLSSRHTKRGVVVTEGNGIALYTFTGRSCNGACQQVWHPLRADGRLVAARGSRLDARLIGRVRNGRTYQVTYDHHRLFTFAGDHKAGQITGEGKHQFGGFWYVVGLRGAILKPRKGGFCSGVCGLY